MLFFMVLLTSFFYLTIQYDKLLLDHYFLKFVKKVPFTNPVTLYYCITYQRQLILELIC